MNDDEIIDNLDFLLNMDVVEESKDKEIIQDLDLISPEASESEVESEEKGEQ